MQTANFQFTMATFPLPIVHFFKRPGNTARALLERSWSGEKKIITARNRSLPFNKSWPPLKQHHIYSDHCLCFSRGVSMYYMADISKKPAYTSPQTLQTLQTPLPTFPISATTLIIFGFLFYISRTARRKI